MSFLAPELLTGAKKSASHTIGNSIFQKMHLRENDYQNPFLVFSRRTASYKRCGEMLVQLYHELKRNGEKFGDFPKIDSLAKRFKMSWATFNRRFWFRIKPNTGCGHSTEKTFVMEAEDMEMVESALIFHKRFISLSKERKKLARYVIEYLFSE